MYRNETLIITDMNRTSRDKKAITLLVKSFNYTEAEAIDIVEKNTQVFSYISLTRNFVYAILATN